VPLQPSNLRCLHYLPSIDLAQGGVVRAVLDLCGAVSELGVDVTLVTHDDRDVPMAWRQCDRSGSNVPRVVVWRGGRAVRLGLSAEVRRLARRAIESQDVIHLHTPWDPANRWLAGLARAVRRPYGVSIHGMLDDWSMSQRGIKKRAYLAIFGGTLLSGARFVHCTAEGERRQATRWFNPARACVVPLVFDASSYIDLPGPGPAIQAWPTLAGDWRRILLMSRLHPKKGADKLIAAMGGLGSRFDDVRLVLAGPGEPAYLEHLRTLVRRHGIEHRVLFTGMVTGREKVSLLQWADVFVLPTSQENFGFSLVEAMAAGTAVVTTPGVDIWPELAQAGAIIVQPDPIAITQTLESLLDDPTRRAAMGEQGRDWTMNTFGRDEVARQYLAMYQRACDRSEVSESS
jgi:glycosyltransferase involved in cell wall biosynthesis